MHGKICLLQLILVCDDSVDLPQAVVHLHRRQVEYVLAEAAKQYFFKFIEALLTLSDVDNLVLING